jgi:hypothetical protein
MELIFKNFLHNKVIVEFNNDEGNLINFQKEIDDLFKLLRENKLEFYEDLKGNYLSTLEKDQKGNDEKLLL